MRGVIGAFLFGSDSDQTPPALIEFPDRQKQFLDLRYLASNGRHLCCQELRRRPGATHSEKDLLQLSETSDCGCEVSLAGIPGFHAGALQSLADHAQAAARLPSFLNFRIHRCVSLRLGRGCRYHALPNDTGAHRGRIRAITAAGYGIGQLRYFRALLR